MSLQNEHYVKEDYIMIYFRGLMIALSILILTFLSLNFDVPIVEGSYCQCDSSGAECFNDDGGPIGYHRTQCASDWVNYCPNEPRVADVRVGPCQVSYFNCCNSYTTDCSLMRRL